MQNLLELNQRGLTDFFAALGEKPSACRMRARQTLKWLHQAQVSEFDAMTDIARNTRGTLAARAVIRDLTVIRDVTAADGTRKWLFDVGSSAIETVFIPEDDRGTLCISSQAGCALDCAFCSTGKQGFNRNLTTGEIIAQLRYANRALKAERGISGRTSDGVQPVTNVVMMGMGEPLANFAQLVPALELMLDDHAYGLSRRRVTVSTSGLVPRIDELARYCP
ncbi:MAG: radical SAM protein, partial [Casimicrobiaceae bacterium]